MPRPFPSTFLPIHHSSLILPCNLVTDSVSFSRCCWTAFVGRTRNQWFMFIYPSLQHKAKENAGSLLTCASSRRFKSSSTGTVLILEITTRLALCPSAVLRGKRHEVVFVECTCSVCCLAQQVGTSSMALCYHVSARKRNRICSNNMYVIFWRPCHVGVFMHHWKQVTFTLKLAKKTQRETDV
jgi:hypothetical protein